MKEELENLKVGDPLPVPDSKIIIGGKPRLTDDEKSRKFWERIFGIIYLLMFIGILPILNYITRVSMIFLPDLGQIPWCIVLVLFIGLWYKVNASLYGELDRRFPPFDKSGDSIQRMRSEINYNYKRDHS